MRLALGRLQLALLVSLIIGFAANSSAGNLVGGLEPGDRQFEEFELGSRLVYFCDRLIDGVVIEGDFINYQFDASTTRLLARNSHWRDDLPEHLPQIVVSREAAEAMVAGAIQASRLVLISPQSAVLPIRPTPTNPCWVVRSEQGGRITITVIDAVTGKLVGYGVPPPYTAFSFTGPADCPQTIDWSSWYGNARVWFNTMGYQTEGAVSPTLEKVRGHVKSDQTAMFYEIAHGDYSLFNYGCVDGAWQGLAAFKIGTWIGNYAKMPFAFIASCDGMCSLGPSTFSYEFRKGSFENAATVGYCGMSETQCADCWNWSIDWQNALFSYMSQGWTVKAAFDQADADYPTCGANACMRFAGDESFKVVPAGMRDPEAPSVTVVSPNGGETLEYGSQYEIRWRATDNARVTSVTILLSTDGGASFPDTIASGEPNDSSYVWTVPDRSSDAARIRVIAFDGVPNAGIDASDGNFTLWGTTAGVREPQPAGVPAGAMLNVVGANPAGAGCHLLYGIPAGSHVSLAVYDAGGRLVDHLVSGYRDGGYYRVDWSSQDRPGAALSPGIYFVRLDCDRGSATAKVVVAR